MESIHGHEVLNMMIESGEQYSNASLEAAITARFGEQARFHTCSAADMTAGELVAFLAAKESLLQKKTASLRTKARSAVTDFNG
jgi:probable metal-binding protein